jgi:hypothetical protein
VGAYACRGLKSIRMLSASLRTTIDGLSYTQIAEKVPKECFITLILTVGHSKFH